MFQTMKSDDKYFLYKDGKVVSFLNHIKYKENGGAAASPPPPHFLDTWYGLSVACTVGCTWLMYDPYMAYV